MIRVVETLVDPASLIEPWMGYIAIGTSNTAVDGALALVAEVCRKAASVRVVSNTYFASASFGQDEPTDDGLLIYEVGLFDSLSGGNMAHRWVLDTGIAKDNIDEFVTECAITVLHGSA
jgi:hypothetical protein